MQTSITKLTEDGVSGVSSLATSLVVEVSDSERENAIIRDLVI